MSCSEKRVPKKPYWVKGKVDQNLWSPRVFFLTHSHVTKTSNALGLLVDGGLNASKKLRSFLLSERLRIGSIKHPKTLPSETAISWESIKIVIPIMGWKKNIKEPTYKSPPQPPTPNPRFPGHVLSSWLMPYCVKSICKQAGTIPLPG